MSGNTNQAVSTHSLGNQLAKRISQLGKITFRDWMYEALYHPTLGYYNRADLIRWGRGGDYRTSPDRSELFAATFARYFIWLYREMNNPTELVIVETGAGNGQFAAGVLATMEQTSPEVFSKTRYVVLERSDNARRRSSELLQSFGDRVQFTDWKNLKPVNFGIFFSNELLDAFPVHRLTLRDGELQEMFVTTSRDGQFAWTIDALSSPKLEEFCQEHVPHLSEGQIVEVNLEIKDWFQTVAEKLTAGYLITVDYGAEAAELYSSLERHDGTLRAFRRHQFVEDVLSEPGAYDITSSVNWTYVKSEGAKRGLSVQEFAQLDKFLMQIGILQELEARLSRASSEVERSTLTLSAREMILPGGMASSFQTLVQRR